MSCLDYLHSLDKNLLPLENVILNDVLRRKLKKGYFMYIFCGKKYFFQEKWDIFKCCPYCENTLLINILWGNPPPPSNCPYSSGEGVVNIVQVWHSDAQPGIVQRARIRSFLVTGMTLRIALPIKSQTCSFILRVGDLDGHCMVDISCCSNHVTVRQLCGLDHYHVETRMDDCGRQISFV